VTSSHQQIKKAALSRLGDIPANQMDRDRIAIGLRDEIDAILTEKHDAQWDHDTKKVSRLKYQLMVKRTMIKILSRNGVR